MTRIRTRECRRKIGGRIPQWSTLLPFYISAILLPTSINSQSLFRGISFTELVEPYVAARMYDPNNPSETCFDVLYESDADGNGIVTNDEYNTFVAQLSEGDFNVTNYIDLPFVIKVNFVYLSCLCRFLPENSDECCKGPDGGIYTSGAGPDEVPTDDEEAYLVTVCSETQGAIDYARDETTSSPTIVTTDSPTVGPTSPPSVEPTKSVSLVLTCVRALCTQTSPYYLILIPHLNFINLLSHTAIKSTQHISLETANTISFSKTNIIGSLSVSIYSSTVFQPYPQTFNK